MDFNVLNLKNGIEDVLVAKNKRELIKFIKSKIYTYREYIETYNRSVNFISSASMIEVSYQYSFAKINGTWELINIFGSVKNPTEEMIMFYGKMTHKPLGYFNTISQLAKFISLFYKDTFYTKEYFDNEIKNIKESLKQKDLSKDFKVRAEAFRKDIKELLIKYNLHLCKSCDGYDDKYSEYLLIGDNYPSSSTELLGTIDSTDIIRI